MKMIRSKKKKVADPISYYARFTTDSRPLVISS